MNCVIAPESTDAEAAIRRLEARYQADRRLFDDPSLAPLGRATAEAVWKCFAILRTLADQKSDLADAQPLSGRRVHEGTHDDRSLRIISSTGDVDILSKMRRMLVAEKEHLENEASACCRLVHAIDRHRASNG